MLADSTKGSATPDQGGSSLLGDQSGGHQDAVADEGAGILDLPGDLESSGHAIRTTAYTAGECTRGRAITLEVPEIFAGRQTATG